MLGLARLGKARIVARRGESWHCQARRGSGLGQARQGEARHGRQDGLPPSCPHHHRKDRGMAWRGIAWRVEAGQGVEHGRARRDKAWPGKASRGFAGQGVDRGKAGHCKAGHCQARQGSRHGAASRGKAVLGQPGRCKAREAGGLTWWTPLPLSSLTRIVARQCGARPGLTGLGSAWQGRQGGLPHPARIIITRIEARHGPAWQGRARQA